MTAPTRYVDPLTGRCSRCHQHTWRCTCDGQRCTATSNGDRCQLRPHAGTGHQAKHGAHQWIGERGPLVPEARCTCCTGHDGLGIHHFDTVDQLRRFLDTPGREEVCEIDVANVVDQPWGLAFVTAGEAEAWLEEHDEGERAERAYDRRPVTR